MKKNYKYLIGDGKLPNKYWVFQYDQKYKRVKDNGGAVSIEIIEEDTTTEDTLIGEYKTYREALEAVDTKAYLPNVVIEDRISGQVFEQICIKCQECDKEEWETINDIRYTKERLGEKFE